MPEMLQLILIAISFVHVANAFPQYLGRQIVAQGRSSSDALHSFNSRQLSELGSLLGQIPTSFDLPPAVAAGRKRIPDEDHPFIAPGPTDVRGGCPGLNIMANYGYISRDGITHVTELIWAQQEMLGFGSDLALYLTGLGLKTSFDLTTLKISIGGTDSRTDGPLSGLFGTSPGLFSAEAHNKYEIDGSIAEIDAYFANGETNQFSSDRWKKYRQLAVEKYGGVMNTKWSGEARFLQYNECRYHNPECHWAVVDELNLYAAQAFVSTMMASADENGNPMPADVRSIDTFFGFAENPDGSFSREHSRLPPSPDGHWYRRAVPLTFPQQTLTFRDTILAYPVEFGRNNGKLGSWDSDSTQLPNLVEANVACYLLQQTRDPKDSRYSHNPQITQALGTLLRNTFQPLFEELSC